MIGVPIRHFEDDAGVHWQVWSTLPATEGVAGAFRQGWLTFDSVAERRRLAPIPSNWETASEAQLDTYRQSASAVRMTPPSSAASQPDPGNRS